VIQSMRPRYPRLEIIYRFDVAILVFLSLLGLDIVAGNFL
jgi:hypothetical protein